MTCPSLVRRTPAPGEVGACLRTAVDAAARAAREVLRRLPRGDAAGAQLGRFASAGLLATSLQVVLFTALTPGGVLLAHLVSWSASTALANELHRRRSFRAGGRVGVLAAQLEGGGLALLGLLVITSALGTLTVAAPDAGTGLQTLVLVAVTTTVGLLRFVALRWSFVLRRQQPA